MEILLKEAKKEQAELILKMQQNAFAKHYEKYQDSETSPATETLERVITRMENPCIYHYLIEADGETVGAVRVVDKQDMAQVKHFSQILVLEEFQNKGIAQAAMREIEKIHGAHNWELLTMLDAKKNRYLYEKMGYAASDQTVKINEKLTLIIYRKA